MVRYESVSSGDKLDRIKRFYREKITSLELKANRFLVGFVDRFQGLVILHQEIDNSSYPEEHIVI